VFVFPQIIVREPGTCPEPPQRPGHVAWRACDNSLRLGLLLASGVCVVREHSIMSGEAEESGVQSHEATICIVACCIL
jgi:hypothetical protein